MTAPASALLVAIAPGATIEERCRLLRSLGSEDPAAFVISANIYRRLMTKGQRAMTVAKIYPEPKRGSHSELKNSTEHFGFDKGYLSRARTVLRFAPDLADGVLTGSTSLDEAYKTARKSVGVIENHSSKMRP